MSAAPLGTVLQHLRKIVAAPTARDSTDAQLLHAFAAERDQSAFAALVQRHGALVMSVCRHVLRQEQDAEDAFQATFLVLARQAAAIRKPDSLASWLHGVALRISWNARKAAARRHKHEHQAPPAPPLQPPSDLAWPEVQALLDEEIQRLPPKFRTVFVLCCMESHSRAEVARYLGIKEGTISSRLAQARSRLQHRLARRGVTLSVVLGATALADQTARAAVTSQLVEATAQAAWHLAANHPAAAGLISAEVTALIRGATSGWAALSLKTWALVLVVAATLTAASGSLLYRTTEAPVNAGPAAAPTAPYTQPLHGPDLTQIDRTIFREPRYQSPPKYGLLVFGPQAATRVWFVLDGDTLYVDRKGTGDLTDPDQRLTAAQLAPALEFPRTDAPDPGDGRDQVHQFKVGDVPDPVHQVTHQDLTVTCCRFSNGEARATLSALVAGRRWQYSSSGPLLLGDRPETAPIIHLGGPLTWKLVKLSALHRGQETIPLQAVLGTPGLGDQAFAPLGLQDLPAAMTVTALVTFPGPNRDGELRPVVVSLTRSPRATGPNLFTGSVAVPANLGAGRVRIVLSCPNAKAYRLLPDPGTEVPIVPATTEP